MIHLKYLLNRISSTNSNVLRRNMCSSVEVKSFLRLVYNHAVESVNPMSLMRKELQLEDDCLVTSTNKFRVNKNCYVVGFGKAVIGMAHQVEEILGDHVRGGVLSIPIGQKELFKSLKFKDNSVIKIYEGAKDNIPDEHSEVASNHIKNLATSLRSGDLLLVLISGGGSALLTCPVPPVTLDEKVKVIRLLQNSGASIKELNCVRKRLSQLKGGKLLDLAYPAEVFSFILSDIVDDPLDFIASGPTVPNKDSSDQALNIIQKYSLTNDLPESVKNVLHAPPLLISTPNTGISNLIIGSNRIALHHASIYAIKSGYCSVILSSCVEGLVSKISEVYMDLIILISKAINKEIEETLFLTNISNAIEFLRIDESSVNELVSMLFKSNETKLCLLFGGEPTVRVNGNGTGGRNQQLALEFSNLLETRFSKLPLADSFRVGFVSGGTDGIDGPTDAAGALAYQGQLKNINLNATNFIENNDSYSFFKQLNNGDDLIFTGHTGTNVMDIHVISIEKCGY
ncbi:hypothetical protein LSTR_LSTR000263 [Laodelphax striatellus]|uniref:Glycerate kinase n=1 Tax=Laodelphax striatellus TaxID=195883 RepID=A0A482X6N5_LAOST|nr:hypothetical protein LSTR_LSTR000263 [Laodelphax striatellus]